MKTLEEYYNKFNEDKRLDTRRGQVEYNTSMKYIHKYLKKDSKIIDIGAGTGKYTIALYNEGYNITAIELIKHNLQIIKQKEKKIKAFQGNALDLSKFKDEEFDVTLLFGPMYHLKKESEQISSLNEAKRITKIGGIILVSYCMNEYAVITYGFKNNNIKENIKNNDVTNNYHITEKGNVFYKYMRLNEINKLNKECKLKRIKIIAADGPASYMKEYLNKMDKETFNSFLDYHYKTCEQKELLGASTHILDILKKN